MTVQAAYQYSSEIDSVILDIRVKLDTLHSLTEGIVSSPQDFQSHVVADLAYDYSEMILSKFDRLEDLICEFKTRQKEQP